MLPNVCIFSSHKIGTFRDSLGMSDTKAVPIVSESQVLMMESAECIPWSG